MLRLSDKGTVLYFKNSDIAVITKLYKKTYFIDFGKSLSLIFTVMQKYNNKKSKKRWFSRIHEIYW